MTEEEIYKQLNEIFEDILEIDNINLTSSTTADDVEGWDSLAHISLITSIERHFKIKFSMNEIVNLHNVGNLVSLIEQKINN